MKDWYLGECEAIPGKTMHKLAVVERDYTKLYEKLLRAGRGGPQRGPGGPRQPLLLRGGVRRDARHAHTIPVEEIDGKKYPSLKEDRSRRRTSCSICRR